MISKSPKIRRGFSTPQPWLQASAASFAELLAGFRQRVLDAFPGFVTTLAQFLPGIASRFLDFLQFQPRFVTLGTQQNELLLGFGAKFSIQLTATFLKHINVGAPYIQLRF